MNKDYPMLTVVVVALTLMMAVQIFGIYFDALFPKVEVQRVFECDFDMGESVMTRPCTVRGEWNE